MLDRRALEARQASTPLPVRDLFRARFQDIRSAYRGTSETGCLVLAVDPARGITAATRVEAPGDGSPTWVTLGRHDRCHLCLTDPAVSLRHALLVLRLLPTGDLRVRLLDLRSGLGIRGEDGRVMEAVSVEGHLFLGVGRYVVMVLLGGEDLDLSPDAGAVFDALPPRVFCDERARLLSPALPDPPVSHLQEGTGLRFATGTGLRARNRGITDFHSRVAIMRPPGVLGRSPVVGGDRRGTLRLSCEAGTAAVPVYEPQARDGLLLGRYDRCETADIPFELPATVSRVHALVLAEGNHLHAMDTGSMCGLSQGPEPVSGVHLDGPTTFLLGPDTTVTWEPTP
jgi:hypothetical protein